jgi:hypothetical protein
MSILALTSDTLVGTAGAGQIEYDGQFFGTDSNSSRAQLQRIVQATSQTTTSGTSKDFTSIPAWVERITVMMQTVSANGTSNWLVQIGAGSIQSTGYTSGSQVGGGGLVTSTAGMILSTGTAALNWNGHITFTALGSNIWVSSHVSARSDGAATMGGGSVTLSGTLDRLRFTTVNGTDVFDLGAINIIYEG